ncbi:hypothetical protein [Murimonas intestini]|uniref:Uncharacterized protein n=1 Tax=Murimonas intestini TaxID=1337051 RepID=A0AB73T9U5_9FIRM|nr:hypothetical protein [Murimonas intestini]MCR1839235.1 hypothetical protein [Murimonas intestini]MCR1864531.1 hypothetical protein [Murimonas intestini]MCR1882141.1 hypothetical protein [Murimonas intestini]
MDILKVFDGAGNRGPGMAHSRNGQELLNENVWRKMQMSWRKKSSLCGMAFFTVIFHGEVQDCPCIKVVYPCYDYSITKKKEGGRYYEV